MSSLDSEGLSSAISESIPISQLIKVIRHSFRECEYNEVESILMDREKNMKMEMENLLRDRDSVKEEVLLLEKAQSLVELEKLKLEEKFQTSERKCEELTETITRLREEQRVSSARVKRAEERYDRVCEQNTKMANDKNKLILELNEKNNELKKKNLESQRLAGVYQEKLKCSDEKIVKLGQEIEILRRDKLAADQTAEELRRKNLEADQVLEELKRHNIEVIQNAEELMVKKLESDKMAKLYKSRAESLEPRVMKVEEELANILNVKVEDLGNLVVDMDKPAAAEKGPNVKFLDPKDERVSLGSGSGREGRNVDAENDIVVSPGARSTCNSTGVGGIGLSKKGGGNMGESSLAKEDAANTVQTFPGSQSGWDPPQVEINNTGQDKERKEIKRSGRHASGISPIKMATSSFAAEDIIEIYDSDDETNPSGPPYIPETHADMGEDGMISEELAHSPSSSNNNKRNRTECKEDSNINLVKKSKRSNEDGVPTEKENPVLESTITQPQRFYNGLNDGDCIDSDDESCSDSCMDKLVATLKSKRKWDFVAEMLEDFQKDPELCLNAVCTLYRQQRFNPIDLESGRALAKYLIDGDKERRLRKSVSEVKRKCPGVLSQCKMLATRYHEELYEIYEKEKDPFFGQT